MSQINVVIFYIFDFVAFYVTVVCFSNEIFSLPIIIGKLDTEIIIHIYRSNEIYCILLGTRKKDHMSLKQGSYGLPIPRTIPDMFD